MLTEDRKLKRMAYVLDFLDRFQKADQFLKKTVTGNEKWISHMTPESKRQSMEWHHRSTPVWVKAKQTISPCKVTATGFWDRHEVLLVDFSHQRTRVNAATYCATLTKLRRAIQNKRRGLLTNGVLLLHDNSRSHSAIYPQNLTRSFGWEQIDHPPNSQDLEPSDFHWFRYLKEFLGVARYRWRGERSNSRLVIVSGGRHLWLGRIEACRTLWKMFKQIWKLNYVEK